jgi:hypothetical protein
MSRDLEMNVFQLCETMDAIVAVSSHFWFWMHLSLDSMGENNLYYRLSRVKFSLLCPYLSVFLNSSIECSGTVTEWKLILVAGGKNSQSHKPTAKQTTQGSQTGGCAFGHLYF